MNCSTPTHTCATSHHLKTQANYPASHHFLISNKLLGVLAQMETALPPLHQRIYSMMLSISILTPVFIRVKILLSITLRKASVQL